jgi:MerR family transcriptional regulator, heat shock protein HspR
LSDDDARALYVISVAAQLAGVHPQTLRNYERSGLLDPSRTSGGSRRFSEADLARLRRIQQLTAEGVNLEGVRQILALEARAAELADELAAVRAQVAQQVADTHRHYRRDLVPVKSEVAIYVTSSRRGADRDA